METIVCSERRHHPNIQKPDRGKETSFLQNFHTSVANLRKLDSFSIEAGTVNLVTSATGSVRFLAKILEPFLFGYRQVLTFVSEPGRDAEKALPEKELAKKVQGVGFQLAEKGQLLFLDALSLDLIGNALASLRSLSRKEGWGLFKNIFSVCLYGYQQRKSFLRWCRG